MYELIIETKEEKIKRLIEEIKEIEEILNEYKNIECIKLERIQTKIE